LNRILVLSQIVIVRIEESFELFTFTEFPHQIQTEQLDIFNFISNMDLHLSSQARGLVLEPALAKKTRLLLLCDITTL
jgi:hypothetical protein